jgi:hypothetical protein
LHVYHCNDFSIINRVSTYKKELNAIKKKIVSSVVIDAEFGRENHGSTKKIRVALKKKKSMSLIIGKEFY